MKLKGKVHKYGANVDTDVIIPSPYLTLTDPAELAKHCLEGTDPDFISRVQPGDIIVAGTNFGCGSSREHAPYLHKGGGGELRHRCQLRPHLLSECHKHRPAHPGVRGGGAG